MLLAQQAFRAHDVDNENRVSMVAVKDAAWRFDDLAIAGSSELLRSAAAFGVLDKLFDVTKYALDEFRSRNRVFSATTIE